MQINQFMQENALIKEVKKLQLNNHIAHTIFLVDNMPGLMKILEIIQINVR